MAPSYCSSVPMNGAWGHYVPSKGLQLAKLTFTPQRRYNVTVVIRLAKELRKDLDRLSSGEQVVERHSRHTSHFDVVNEAH